MRSLICCVGDGFTGLCDASSAVVLMCSAYNSLLPAATAG